MDAWWSKEVAYNQLWSTLEEAWEERSRRRQGEGVSQYEKGYGRHREVSWDAVSDTSDAWAGE